MVTSKLLEKARAMFEIVRLSKGQTINNIDIPVAPKEREQFLNSTDEWQHVDLPDSVNATTSMFYAKKYNYFPPHKHDNASEQIIITNKGGKFKSITNDKIEIIEYPNSAFYKKGEVHSVIWLEDTDVLILWSPAFKDNKAWEATI